VIRRLTIVILLKELHLVKECNLNVLVKERELGIQKDQAHVTKRHMIVITFQVLIWIKDQHSLHALVLMGNGIQQEQDHVMRKSVLISLMKLNAMLLRDVSLLTQNAKLKHYNVQKSQLCLTA